MMPVQACCICGKAFTGHGKENLKPKSPPYRGVATPILAAGAAASRPPWQPPSVDHDALPAAAAHSTMQERRTS